MTTAWAVSLGYGLRFQSWDLGANGQQQLRENIPRLMCLPTGKPKLDLYKPTSLNPSSRGAFDG